MIQSLKKWLKKMKNKMSKRSSAGISIIFICLCIMITVSCNRDDDVIARVGNTVLSKNDMQKRMEWEGFRPDQDSEFVERWVNRELLFQEAKRLGLDRNGDELKWEVELVEKEYLIQKLLERTFADKIEISEDEIVSHYEQNKNQFMVEKDEIRALHILSEKREDAVLALQEIRAGKVFQDVARERSQGIFRENGGDIGFFQEGDVNREIWRMARRLGEGEVSGIFHSEHGYHILKMIQKRTKGNIKDLEDVRSEILQRIRITRESAVYYDLVYDLQNKVKVYVSVPPKSANENQDTVSTHDNRTN